MKTVSLIILLAFLNTHLYSQTPEKLNPVLVELFTSEGCSSCPPADEAMADLQKEYRLLQKPVYFIAYHVDYWNYLGWKDAFSSPVYTSRQKEYAEAFSLRSIYTPQSVINGRRELVGSKKQALKDAIEAALVADQRNDKLSIKADLDKSHAKIIVKYQFSGNVSDKEIHFVLLEKEKTIKVLRGENGGSELKHINIVKQWEHESLSLESVYEFKLKDNTINDDFKFIAFIQSAGKKSITSVVEVF